MPRVDPLIGQYLDEYRIERPLGTGGMAHVYLALDTRLRRYTALKVIAPSLRTDESYEQRFEREAQAIAQLEHPNIVRVYRFGVAQDLYYMAMQYIGGADVAWLIKDYRKRNAPMSLSDVQAVATEIGAALDYAHEQKVIHRDVKPGNILIDKDGHAILTDFGLALHADFGTQGDIFGSPHYMSPEQVVSSANAIPQSDFYAFGVTLFEMLTGALPFGEGSPMDIAMRHVSDQPPPPSQFNPELTEAIDAVILRTLEKEPEKRFQTGAEISTALKNAIKQGRSGQTSVMSKRASRRTIPERVRVYVEESALPIESKISPSEPAPPPPPPPATPAVLPPNFGEDLPLGESAFLESWSVAGKPAPAVSLAGEDKKKVDQLTPKKPASDKAGTSSPIPTIPLAIGLGVVGVIVLLLVISRLIGGTNTTGTPTNIAQALTNPASPNATDAPTATITLTASATPFPTPNTVTLGRRFRSGSWIALVNTGRWPLDLTNVQLKREADVISAEKGWGRTALQPGECLRLYRGDKAPTEKPNDCKTVIDFIGETSDRAYWSAPSVRIWWSKSYSEPMPQ